MTTPEGRVKQKIKAWEERRLPGRYRFAPRGGPFGNAGTADEIICFFGVFIAIEVKSETGEATPLQMRKLREVKAAGGIAALVKGFDLSKLELIRKLAIQRAYCYKHLLDPDQQAQLAALHREYHDI